MSKDPGPSKLFKYFFNKHVSIVMKNVKGSQTLADGTIMRGNVVLDGFLIDEDGTNLYFGTTPDEVNEALQKSDIVRIFSFEPEGDEFIDMDDDGGRTNH